VINHTTEGGLLIIMPPQGKENFMKNFIALKVRHGGIYLSGFCYFHPKLSPYVGEYVLVKQKKEKLKVYSHNGVFICKAKIDLFN